MRIPRVVCVLTAAAVAGGVLAGCGSKTTAHPVATPLPGASNAPAPNTTGLDFLLRCHRYLMGPAISGQLSWWLFHAACCRFRNSSWTSRGVLYPSPEWRR
jgi:hypothetical protein